MRRFPTKFNFATEFIDDNIQQSIIRNVEIQKIINDNQLVILDKIDNTNTKKDEKIKIPEFKTFKQLFDKVESKIDNKNDVNYQPTIEKMLNKINTKEDIQKENKTILVENIRLDKALEIMKANAEQRKKEKQNVDKDIEKMTNKILEKLRPQITEMIVGHFSKE
jgi:hypothetical protein